MIGRIVQSADFQRVLRGAAKVRSTHFAVHHLAGCPSSPGSAGSKRSKVELSTEDAPSGIGPVDDFRPAVVEGCNSEVRSWFGWVVPKRHAKRSVTRSLFKRQIRAALGRHAGELGAGLWVVRLRAPFERTVYPSAASLALQRAARAELDGLLTGAAGRPGAR